MLSARVVGRAGPSCREQGSVLSTHGAIPHSVYPALPAQDWPDGSREVQVYEVEANGEIEATVWELLDEVGSPGLEGEKGATGGKMKAIPV